MFLEESKFLIESSNTKLTVDEYFSLVNKTKIDNEKIKKIKNRLKISENILFVDFVNKVISNSKVIFFKGKNDYRQVSFNEILSLKSDTNLQSNGDYLFLIDCMDNNFILYDINKKSYCMYNSDDEEPYKYSSNIKSFLK